MKGLVLAGGESRRFGSDKALAPWRADSAETFAERAYRVLVTVVGETWVSCREGQGLTFTSRLIHDRGAAAEGPGAGLREAHRRFPGEDWLVLGCDYPGADEECLAHLCGRWNGAQSALVFKGAGTLFEPLLGIWSAGALECFLGVSPLPGPHAVLEAVGATAIDCPEPRWLVNVNAR
jgi:molybdopterin-guanine dinucleotide biosynthesis protein A